MAVASLASLLQVDLATSSIRPARSPAWQQSLGATLLAAVEESTADITVFTGTWQHDIDQVGFDFHLTGVVDRGVYGVHRCVYCGSCSRLLRFERRGL